MRKYRQNKYENHGNVIFFPHYHCYYYYYNSQLIFIMKSCLILIHLLQLLQAFYVKMLLFLFHNTTFRMITPLITT